jgi:hypothetical protein
MKRVREKKENIEDQSHFSAHSPLFSLVSVPSQFLLSFLSILSNLIKLSLTIGIRACNKLRTSFNNGGR